jgi:hypothetical protein
LKSELYKQFVSVSNQFDRKIEVTAVRRGEAVAVLLVQRLDRRVDAGRHAN